MAAREHWLPSWPFHGSPEAGEIHPLAPADARALHLPWSSPFSAGRLARHVTRWPGYSWLAPASGEYLVTEPWRRRDDIALIVDVHARRGRPALLEHAAAALSAAGTRMLLVPEGEWKAHPRAYQEQGFAPLEKIVYYQLLGLGGGPVPTRPLPSLAVAPLATHNFEALLAVDHAAFPWLWWNSAAEFRSYVGQTNVQIWLGRAAGVPVAYAGFTTLDHWGHLDRLAVDPAWHGRGYGAAMLAHALGCMATLAVHRVTLSTQETNIQSQRLYQGFGFRRTAEVAELYGRALVTRDQGPVTSDQ